MIEVGVWGDERWVVLISLLFLSPLISLTDKGLGRERLQKWEDEDEREEMRLIVGKMVDTWKE